jgi:hypothetical protein
MSYVEIIRKQGTVSAHMMLVSDAMLAVIVKQSRYRQDADAHGTRLMPSGSETQGQGACVFPGFQCLLQVLNGRACLEGPGLARGCAGKTASRDGKTLCGFSPGSGHPYSLCQFGNYRSSPTTMRTAARLARNYPTD